MNRKLRVVTVGGCAGRLDGTRLKVTDLRDSRDDPLMMLVRKRLRQNFDFPRGKAPFGVSCVWSDEPFTQPTDCAGLPGGEIPEGHYEAENMKQTVVPFRNGIMLAIATGLAESHGADGLVIAAHAGDHARTLPA